RSGRARPSIRPPRRRRRATRTPPHGARCPAATTRPWLRSRRSRGSLWPRPAAPLPPLNEDPAAWSALPGRDDAAVAPIATLARLAETEADVFYVHPTSYVGSRWNASLDDAAVNAATDAGATRIQATVFGCCGAGAATRHR